MKFRRDTIDDENSRLIFFYKGQRINEYISKKRDLLDLKEDVRSQFKRVRDNIIENLNHSQINIMNEIEKLQAHFKHDIQLKQMQQYLESLQNIRFNDALYNDSPIYEDFMDCLLREDENTFIQSHFSFLIRKVAKIEETVHKNVEEQLENFKGSIKKVLDQTQYSDITQLKKNLFNDISQFKGDIAQNLPCGQKVYSITQYDFNSFAITTKPYSIKLFQQQSYKNEHTKGVELKIRDQNDFLHYTPDQDQSLREFQQYHLNDSWGCTCEYTCNYQPRSIIAIGKQSLAVGTKEGSILIFEILNKTKYNQEILSFRQLFNNSHTQYKLILLHSIQQNIMLRDMCRLTSTTLACVSLCGRVQIWNYSKGKLLKELRVSSQYFEKIKDVNESYLAVSSSKITLLDKVTLNVFIQYEDIEMGYILTLEKFDSQRLIFGGTDCKVRVWNFITNQIEHILSEHDNSICQVKRIAKNHIISCQDDGQIMIWDLSQNNHCLLKIQSNSESVHALQILPNHCKIVTAGKYHSLSFWN